MKLIAWRLIHCPVLFTIVQPDSGIRFMIGRRVVYKRPARIKIKPFQVIRNSFKLFLFLNTIDSISIRVSLCSKITQVLHQRYGKRCNHLISESTEAIDFRYGSNFGIKLWTSAPTPIELRHHVKG